MILKKLFRSIGKPSYLSNGDADTSKYKMEADVYRELNKTIYVNHLLQCLTYNLKSSKNFLCATYPNGG
jgi:hypothetical protein